MYEKKHICFRRNTYVTIIQKKHIRNNSVLRRIVLLMKKIIMCVCIKLLFKVCLKAIIFLNVRIHIMALKNIFLHKFCQKSQTK